MKKFLSLLMICAILLTMCACGSLKNIELPPLPTFTPTPAPAPVQETATPSAEPKPEPEKAEVELEPDNHIIVKIETTELNEYDPQSGEKLILSFSYDTPIVYIEGRDEAAAKINEFAAFIEESYYTGEDYGEGYGTGYMNMLTMAEDEYNYMVSIGNEGGMYELSSSQKVSVARADKHVLTLVYDGYTYLGGAHGSYVERGYCFDSETGDILTLAKISNNYSKLAEFLVDYMIEKAENDPEIYERLDLLPENVGYDEIFSALLRDGSWYFNAEGMLIFSDVYEISSYASGPVSFTVPYDQLKDLIDERFFPESRDGNGSFKLLTDAQMQNGSTVIIDKLTAAGEAEQFYVVADGKVYDVVISTVNYSGGFYELGQNWYCSEMNNSALQLVTSVPDGMPNLKITWKTASGEFSKLISQSGENGSYILVNDDIEAVG